MNNPELCEHGRHWRMCPHCLGISRGVNQPAASVTASMRCNGETHYTGCPCHEANWREQMRLLAATKDALIADLESRLAAALEANAKQAEFERDGLRAKLAESERLLTVYRTASIRDGETMRELYTALGKVTNWGVESQALAAKVDGAAEIDRMRHLLSQLAELGVPFVQHPLVALGIVVLLFALGGYSWWRCRAARGSDYAEHVLLTVTGSYGLCGAALLIISRSRYEWGTLIDARNVLQYSFVVLLFLLSAARVLLPAWARTVALVGAVALFVSNAALATRDAVSAYQAPAEPWLVLSEDHALIATVGAMAPEQLLASNAAPLLRLIAHKPVRQLDLVGENGDLAAALRELSVVGHARRPVFFLVCDGMAQDFPMCQTQQAPKGAHCQSVRLDAPFVARCDGFGGP